MWVFTKRSFLSVVEFDPTKDKRPNRPFQNIKKKHTHVLVRARLREDLEDVRSVVKRLKIEEDPSADYSFRAVVPRAKFAEYMLNAVEEIDYDSHFKEVVRDNHKKGTVMYGAMMKVWGSMAAIQPHKPYSGWSSFGSYGTSYGSAAKRFVSTKSKATAGKRPKRADLVAADGKKYASVLNYLLNEHGLVIPEKKAPTTYATTSTQPLSTYAAGGTGSYAYQGALPLDDEYDVLLDDALPAEKYDFPLMGMEDVKTLVLEFGEAAFSKEDYDAMDEDGYELALRLLEVDTQPTEDQVDALIARIAQEGRDPAYARTDSGAAAEA